MADATPNPAADFVTSLRMAVRDMRTVRDRIKPMRERAYTEGWPASLPESAFVGANGDLDVAKVQAVFDALDAVEMVLTDYAQQPPRPSASLAALLKM